MPATIVNALGGSWRNDSEYYYDLEKLNTRPRSLEEADGFRERGKSSDHQTTRVYLCDWSERLAAYEWLLGHSRSELVDGVLAEMLAETIAFHREVLNEEYDPGPVARIVREIPAQDPERPWLFCEEVELVEGRGAWVESPFVFPRGADGVPSLNGPDGPATIEAIHYVDNSQAGTYGVKDVGGILQDDDPPTPPSGAFRDGKAVIRATFRPRDYSVLTDSQLEGRGGNELRRYVRRTEEMAMEALPLARLANAGLVLKFSGGPFAGNPIPEAGVQQYPLKNLTYEWVDVPDLPRGAHARCCGRINQDPFDGLRSFPLYPAKTLLCLPWKYRQTTSITGRITWAVQYRFVFRPQTWLKYPAGDGQFYPATFGGLPQGETVYKTADFNELFLPPPPQSYND